MSYFNVGVFYFTLANFRPEMRSKLNSIFLFGVAKSTVIVEHGFNRILERFVSDMKHLIVSTFYNTIMSYYMFLSPFSRMAYR